MSPKFKVAVIGAGSVEFTKKLCRDILSVPELQDIEIALTDINSTISTWFGRSSSAS